MAENGGSGRERAERREEIKLRLEYLKTAISLLATCSILFAALQWFEANRLADHTVYQKMTSDWQAQLQTFVAKPDLRPYFFEGKTMKDDDPNRNLILAVAESRLDVMDAILSFAARRWSHKTYEGWRNTFMVAFGSSPVLCDLMKQGVDEYGLIVPIAKAGCNPTR
ncbi:hypothetical protein [Rhizobium grahamii]|uniref:Uncharacterized protein n=1 Tax=Rhizobium grahamii CCGE 502 TaxID=990285 RepID=S3HIQ7_9HYPH|nr:hypothetical protein [Rhizobium grahamii]EPE98634.1 hypothetical protein RGCCGE502_09415 [Rhizobium grahamii CCGE 502]